MHLPQIWSFRNCWEIWWSLCSSLEHHKRKNLRLLMVLVRHRLYHHRHPTYLSSCHSSNAKIERNFVENSSSSCSNAKDWNYLSWITSRGLVSPIPTGQKHGSFGLPRFHQRLVQQIRVHEEFGCFKILIFKITTNHQLILMISNMLSYHALNIKVYLSKLQWNLEFLVYTIIKVN